MVVPELSQNMKELHPGLKAKADARAEGKNVFDQDQAYKWAMGDWQDKINREVGAVLGLVRLGPQQKRLSRREQKILDDAQKAANQLEARAIAVAEDRALSVYQTADRTLAAAEEKAAESKRKQSELEKHENAMNEGLNANLKKLKIPEPLPADIKKIPLIGEVFTVGYLNRIYDWAAGLATKVLTLMAENMEMKKRMAHKEKELDKTLIQMRGSLDRLDLKYGEAKQFEEWQTAKTAQNRVKGRGGIKAP
jgi:hypothetical protein